MYVYTYDDIHMKMHMNAHIEHVCMYNMYMYIYIHVYIYIHNINMTPDPWHLCSLLSSMAVHLVFGESLTVAQRLRPSAQCRVVLA
jgi:hypothetical protein